jgi:hypothetical protein
MLGRTTVDQTRDVAIPMSTTFSLTESIEPVAMIYEPIAIAGLPLIPAGRVAGGSGSDLLHRFPSLDWDIAYESATAPGVSQRVVLDLWLRLLAAAEPGSDKVVLRGAESLRRSRAAPQPAGAHYRQRLAALTYMRNARLGPDRLPVISTWMADEENGAIEVRLDPEFCDRHLSGPVAELDPQVLGQLDPGTPRALYRALAWMSKAHPTQRLISAREIVERVGGTRERLQRSRVEQFLDPAHEQLVQSGVLAWMPSYRMRRGDLMIDYTIASMVQVLSPTDVLRTVGLAYGVHRDRLQTLLAQHRDDLIRTLAASALGMMTVSQSLPKMLWTYARRGYRIDDSGRRFDLSAPAASQTRHSHEKYLIWASQECAARFSSSSDLQATVRRLQAQWRRELGTRGGHFPGWVAEGLAQVTLQRLFRLPSLRDYRRAAGLPGSAASLTAGAA